MCVMCVVCVCMCVCVHVCMHVCVMCVVCVWGGGDRVVQPPRGDPWFLGYGLANYTTADRWAGAPF